MSGSSRVAPRNLQDKVVNPSILSNPVYFKSVVWAIAGGAGKGDGAAAQGTAEAWQQGRSSQSPGLLSRPALSTLQSLQGHEAGPSALHSALVDAPCAHSQC